MVAAVALAAASLTVHPGQTIQIARLHVGDLLVCRTPTHALRWKATAANVNATGFFVYDKRLQLNVSRRGSKITVSCERR